MILKNWRRINSKVIKALEQFQLISIQVIRLINQHIMHHRTTSLPHAGSNMISPQHQELESREEGLQLLSRMHLQIKITQETGVRPIIDEGRTNNKILIRRHRNRLKKEEPAPEESLRKTFNHQSRQYRQHEEQYEQVHHSQKAKFINFLQRKVIKSYGGQSPKAQHKQPKQNNHPIKLNSSRYNNQNTNTFRANQSHQKQVVQNEEGNSYRLSTEGRPKLKTQRQRKEENQIISLRSRSRTINKELLSLKKVGSTGQLQKNQISRTIQITPCEQSHKIYKSLAQMENFERKSLGRQTKEVRKSQVIYVEEESSSLVVQRPLISKASLVQTEQPHIMDSQQYQKQINTLTKDFFHQWQKMNYNKSKIYTSLRKKMALLFPNLKKYYEQLRGRQCQGEEELAAQKQQGPELMMQTNNLKSDQIERNVNISSNNSILNPNNISVVKDVQQKLQEFHQKQMLKEIFKQAYFWSRAKNKFMSTSFLNEQQTNKMEIAHLNRIQKDLTFMNYIKRKNGNKAELIDQKRKIKGTNIMKNKESILQIERQGTKQQQFLKKCLDNAIQNCIRQFK